MNVEEIMTKDVITVSPDASIQEAARLMVDHGVSGLPVVDDDGGGWWASSARAARGSTAV